MKGTLSQSQSHPLLSSSENSAPILSSPPLQESNQSTDGVTSTSVELYALAIANVLEFKEQTSQVSLLGSVPVLTAGLLHRSSLIRLFAIAPVELQASAVVSSQATTALSSELSWSEQSRLSQESLLFGCQCPRVSISSEESAPEQLDSICHH